MKSASSPLIWGWNLITYYRRIRFHFWGHLANQRPERSHMLNSSPAWRKGEHEIECSLTQSDFIHVFAERDIGSAQYCDAVTPNLAFLQVAGPRSVLPYIKICLQTCASLWYHEINSLSMCLCIWGFYRILLTTSIRPGLFVTDISKTYVSLVKNVMSTSLMENQAIKTNWGVV